MQKKRVPNAMAQILERSTISIPFALKADGASGPAAYSFLKMVFSHVKIASEFIMRHFHAATEPTWSTTWPSKY